MADMRTVVFNLILDLEPVPEEVLSRRRALGAELAKQFDEVLDRARLRLGLGEQKQ